MGVRTGIAVALALLLAATPLFVPERSSSVPGPEESPVRPLLSPLLYDAGPVAPGTSASPVPPATPVRLTLTLAFSNASRLSTFVASVKDPSSPEYRHFLTAPQFRSEYAPARSVLLGAESALRGAGGRAVTPTADGLAVAAVLPASGVDLLLGVRLVEYRSAGGDLVYTALGSPVLPGPLQGRVAGVGGLSDAINDALRASVSARTPPVRVEAPSQYVYDNASKSQWAVGSDFAQAYHVVDLWPGNGSVVGATYPYGVAVATLLAAGYNDSLAQELPPWDPRVLDQYFNDTLGPGWPQPNLTGVPVTPAGAPTPPAPGSFGPLVDSTADEAENSLDLEMAGSLAPGADLYNFYIAGSLLAVGGPVLGSLADDLADDLAAALGYEYGNARLAVVSGSFGMPELNDSLWDSELVEAAATGVTVVGSSGDQGDAPSLLTGNSQGSGLLWPASAGSNSTGEVSVGGVTVDLTGAPTSNVTGPSVDATFDPNVTGLASMTAWYNAGGVGHVAGSEGGISTVFPEPGWQFHSAAQPTIVAAAKVQRATSLGRAVPDVAMPANRTIAYVLANANGTVYLQVLGGTSVAAPLFAGMMASVVGVENATTGYFGLGFVTPELYRIASFYASTPVVNTSTEASDPFLDVVNGSNYLFSAAHGWDAVTGWGGVNATAFLQADENITVSGYVYIGPTPTLPSTTHPPAVTGTEVLILVVVGLIAVAVVLVAVRPSRRRGAPPTSVPGRAVPAAPYGPIAPGTGPHATFLCPFCGAERPSEPVRCPKCGAL